MPALNLCCPRCLKEGRENPIRLSSSGPSSTYFCNKGHSYESEEALMKENPPPLKNIPRELQPKPPNSVDVTITLNQNLLNEAKKRYGARLNGSIAALVGALCDPNSFVVGGVDAKRMEQHLGLPVRNAQELVGSIYRIVTERDDERRKVNEMTTQAKAGRPVSANGGVTLIMPEGVERTLREKAEANGVTVENFLEGYINHAVKQEWI